MKKLTISLLLLAGVAMARPCAAQVFVDGVDINQLPDVEYIQIVGYNKALFGVNIVISLDHGQKKGFMNNQSIKDANGRTITFNSMIEALNYLNANGWEYVNDTKYSIGNSAVAHFLLRRRKS